MRTIKAPEERRQEILDRAEDLFTAKGYGKTTIIDILEAVGIAKGTFYYYFKSKEEVMDAIIMRIVEADAAAARRIAADPGIPVLGKLLQILMAQSAASGSNKERMIEQFHQLENAEMHQKSLVQSILHLGPVLGDVAEQGVREGLFRTEYPRETVELLLASAQVIFDEGLFRWQPEEAQRRAAAFVRMIEHALVAERGSFDFMLERLAGSSEETDG
ncbi:TetR family transcriptional regulator [Paenibacillus sp. 598K]|uniref:TetR/AcrR family transcriptional regulator n=1 Tax=Paenibacillus sp. 598K TaxID=1117987 RepID=UPI000FFA0F24|nr:TetR/AcrR family transcriptional regulator [Paenibacillus sp. 598K]GBF76730.1 TetR family transcriptional regulator [Paenibacillus sp. 598K]